MFNISTNMNNMLTSSAKQYYKSTSKKFMYGTAGFRAEGSTLAYVMNMMGVLASVRSIATKKMIGLMITASHNPDKDNGIKVVEPNGEMMISTWEEFATVLANSNPDELSKIINSFLFEHNIDPNSFSPTIIIGYDTRSSCPSLLQACIDGASFLNTKIKNIGKVTTPQLHWMVVQSNFGEKKEYEVNDYVKHTEISFRECLESLNITDHINELSVDCSHGIGSLTLNVLKVYIEDIFLLRLLNQADDANGILNYQVGAEYVQTKRVLPRGLDYKDEKLIKSASIDGDADRLVYWYINKSGQLTLLDGDKISCLLATFFKSLIEKSGLDISLGVVQTAYANGSSTFYLRNKLAIPVTFVKTGVKHLHPAAKQYDIGIYFEANGHGTVLFSSKFICCVNEINQSLDESRKNTIKALQKLSKLSNQAVGDAIADILLVEVALGYFGWKLQDWSANNLDLYDDFPSLQLKVAVPDRTIIKTNESEDRVISIPEMQSAIDKLNSSHNGRSFVRPSGTEDVVRVYSEAKTQESCSLLANAVKETVLQFCK